PTEINTQVARVSNAAGLSESLRKMCLQTCSSATRSIQIDCAPYMSRCGLQPAAGLRRADSGFEYNQRFRDTARLTQGFQCGLAIDPGGAFEDPDPALHQLAALQVQIDH